MKPGLAQRTAPIEAEGQSACTRRCARGCALGTVLAVLSLVGCVEFSAARTPGQVQQAYRAAAWPEANRLFRQDSRWLGADAASSVDLRDGRILWLFGDSFIAPPGARQRAQATIVRNTVAVQHGRNPERDTLRYHWKWQGNAPTDFVPGQGSEWFWPAQGVRLGASLSLFYTRLRKETTALGFGIVGSAAFHVRDARGDPDTWRLDPLPLPATSTQYVVASILDDGGYVYAYVTDSRQAARLIRWDARWVANGDLQGAEWWQAPYWVRHTELRGDPTVVIADAASEFSVTRAGQSARRAATANESGANRLVQVQALGFGSVPLGVRFAERPEGPWSAPEVAYRPPEAEKKNVLVYAAKAHPHLSGADLVVTYVATSADFGETVRDEFWYYPRFIRLSLRDR